MAMAGRRGRNHSELLIRVLGPVMDVKGEAGGGTAIHRRVAIQDEGA